MIDHDEIEEAVRSALSEFRAEVAEKLAAILARLDGPAEPRKSYSTAEVAAMLGKSDYSIREYCRLGRINAFKGVERHGSHAIWRVTAEEVARYRDGGLLPIDPERNNAN